MSDRRPSVDWPTLVLTAACYLVWALGITGASQVWLPLGILVTTLMVTLHSSLQHEVLHGHPTRFRALNEALVFLPIGLLFPYGRFRDTHLAHHRDEHLTDPYDDPESNFQDPEVWARLSWPRRALLRFNNTLFGRLIVGPAIGAVCFIGGDMRAIATGDRAIRRDWLLHLAGLVIVARLVQASEMPGWAYLLSAYMGLSILKIRTYLEHRAHELARCRTVVVDGGWLLPFLFLNNNLHVVHHAKPGVAWYRLPALYRANRDDFLRRNGGYRYASYGEVFRRHLFRAKDPVPHPIWPRD
jgi:fatty acid desaturase